jgi:hypothetical protein
VTGRCSFDALKFLNPSPQRMQMFYLDIIHGLFPQKHHSFSVRRNDALRPSLASLSTRRYTSTRCRASSRLGQRDWVIDLSDGEVQSEHAIAPYVCVDVVTIFPQITSQIPTSDASSQSPVSTPSKASSVGPISKGVARCVFRNTPKTGFATRSFSTIKTERAASDENSNYFPILSLRGQFISPN